MIETTITKIQYDADGVQRRWSIPFPYADAKHISIYTKVGEEPTVKVVDNYDIDEDDSVVIYPTIASGQEPLAAGTKIIIARETPETQLEDASQVHFTSKDVERGLDKLTMITQELSTTASETMDVSADAFGAAEGAVNSAAQANKISEEAKTIAGQAVGIATDAKSIAEGIDTKATQALDNSNTAINTANSAKQIAEGVNDKATQALANSTTALETATEAKNTADSYQEQITTIEAKIPINAYTEANLIASNEIEIVPEPVEGGIDNHTLACWHFDEDFNATNLSGIIPDITYENTASQTLDSSTFKFSPGSLKRTDSGFFTAINSNIFNLFTHDFTIDFWHMMSSNLGVSLIRLATSTSTLFTLDSGSDGDGDGGNYVPSQLKINNKLLNTTEEPTGTWNHIACCFIYSTKTVKVFLNGTFYGETILDVLPTGCDRLYLVGGRYSARYDWFDELRISDIVRYTEDFEPPTKPYSVAVPTGNYVVRNKTKLVHKSDIGVANGVASLDENTKVPSAQIPTATTSTLGGVKPDGTTITVTEDGTISSTGGSSSGFDFEGTRAEFDAAVAAGTITEDSVSLITDDVSGDNVATKAELQNKVSKAGDTMTGTLIFPDSTFLQFGVGSGPNGHYYITKGEFGELALYYVDENNVKKGLFLADETRQPYYYDGTNVYRLLTTADLANIDYVVESQVNADGSWYRKYKSGWLEQGGLVTVSGTVGATVTLLKPFENTGYNIQLTLKTTNAVGYLAGTAQSISIANSKTTTSFGVQTAGIQNYEINGISWRAEGQGVGAVTPEPSPEPKPILHKYAWRTADNTLVYANVKELAIANDTVAYLSPYTNDTFSGTHSNISRLTNDVYRLFYGDKTQDVAYSHEVTE